MTDELISHCSYNRHLDAEEYVWKSIYVYVIWKRWVLRAVLKEVTEVDSRTGYVIVSVICWRGHLLLTVM